MMRAKVKCVLTSDNGETCSLSFNPVVTGSEENRKFFKYTPGGTINLQVVSRETAQKFVAGEEYYIDFTPAKEEVVNE